MNYDLIIACDLIEEIELEETYYHIEGTKQNKQENRYDGCLQR